MRQVRSAHPKSCFQPSSEGTGPRWAVFGMSSCARGSSGTLLLDTGGRSRLSNVPFNSRSLEPIHNRQRASSRGSHDPESDCRNAVAPHLCDHERELGSFMATLARRATRSEPDWACVVGVGGCHHSARSARHVTGSDCRVWSSLAPIQRAQSTRARTDNSLASVYMIRSYRQLSEWDHSCSGSLTSNPDRCLVRISI